jgi:hypothetical protein
MNLPRSLVLFAAMATLACPVQAGGLFATLSPEEHHLRFCEAAAELEWEKGAAGAAVQVWHDCIQEAEHRGYAALGPVLRGRLILAQTTRDYGRLEPSNPLLYAQVLLATVAQNTDASFPDELIDAHWHRLLADGDTRQNLASVRTVTLRWLNKNELAPETYELLEQHVRRFVGDRGFKVSLPDTAKAGEASIIVMLEGQIRTGDPIIEGPLTFQVIEGSLESMPVKFKKRNARGAPVKVYHQAQAIHQEVAHAEVLETVSKSFSHQFQYRVVTEVFRNFQIPPP